MIVIYLILSFISSVILTPFVVVIWLFYGSYRSCIYLSSKKDFNQIDEVFNDEKK